MAVLFSALALKLFSSLSRVYLHSQLRKQLILAAIFVSYLPLHPPHTQ